MKCPRCNADNRDGARFCCECGATFGAVCSSCGAKVEARSKFCDSCGAPLEASLAPPSAASRFASPKSYTPKHLAERILTSRTAFEGERKQVTILFADMKGSMELLADRDPEEAREILDPVLERMMEAVHRYEGTVNQVMGDGIMALFGAPLAHEDHAVRACYAALRMQETVKLYAEDARRSHGVEVHIRVGLNSGDVVVRSIGSDLRMDYTAVGQTTHLAARMEQLATPGGIRVTAETLALAEDYVEVKPLGPIPVKGLADAVEVYEVMGAGPARTRLQASAHRGLTRFVGRDAELEHLRVALEQARDGHGQIVAVVGEPGVGKSRLLHEFIRSHRAHGWLVLESASVSYGKATAYLPVLDLLRGYFRIEARDDIRTVREKVAGKVLMLDRALEPAIAAVLGLFDVLPEGDPFATLDPAVRRQRTLASIKALLLRESRVQPVVLVFEDLHWIDSETQSFLDGLAESVPAAAILLLVNYRPEYQHSWGSRTYYRQLRIDPLQAESARELLDSLLGGDPGLVTLKQLLIDRTDGNPFFLEECVRTLVESDVLAGARGGYRPTRAPEAIQVPATVQAILAARIDRLPAEDKELLQTASVIGKDVPFALLAEVAEMPDEALRRGLGHLQAAEFLYETTLFPELEHTFKHALTHEVAYGSLLQERRRALHAKITEAIERVYASRLSDQIERLAHHASRGKVWGKAVGYLHQVSHFRKESLMATTTYEFTRGLDYPSIVATSEKVAWTVDEIFRDRHFDANKSIVPDSWVRTQHLTFLNEQEQRTLNHIRAFSYPHLFCNYEEFIPIHLAGIAQQDWHDDRAHLRALLRFGEEEMKHQQLFRRAEAVLEASCGYTFGRYFDPNKERVTAFTKAFLAYPPLPRFLLLAAFEWGSQRHYVESVRDQPGERSDPLYVDILKYHWIEENQHTKTDALAIEQLARAMSPDELNTAFDHVQALAGLVDETFVGQVDQELATFQAATGRILAGPEATALREALYQSMQAIWAEVALTHPNFKQVALELSKEGAAKLGIV